MLGDRGQPHGWLGRKQIDPCGHDLRAVGTLATTRCRALADHILVLSTNRRARIEPRSTRRYRRHHRVWARFPLLPAVDTEPGAWARRRRGRGRCAAYPVDQDPVLRDSRSRRGRCWWWLAYVDGLYG